MRRMSAAAGDDRAALPAVDRVLRAPEAAPLIERYGRSLVLEAVRTALTERRRDGAIASVEDILAASEASLARLMQPSQRRVFNLTGHGAAHQSRARAVARGGGGGGRRGDAFPHDAGIRPRQRPTRRARRPCRPLADAADRGRGGARGQQQRRGLAAGAERAGGRSRDAGVARRVDRDRRRLPPARHHAARRHPAARGRHHQPHPSARFRRRDRAGDRPDPEGPYQQLRDPGLHRRGAGGAAGRAGAPPRPAAGRGSRQRHAGRSRPLGPAARADRRGGAEGRAPISSRSAATNCSADRRPGSSSAVPT